MRAEEAARARSAACLIALVLAGASCSSEPRQEAPRAMQQRDIERLRSLPYAGGTAAPRDEAVGVVRHQPERSLPGYRLYEVPELGLAELIDERGRVLRRWGPEAGPTEGPGAGPPRESLERWQHVELLAGGELLVVGAGRERGRSPGQPGETQVPAFVARYDPAGGRLWQRALPAHHDIEMTPQGKLLVLTMHRRQEPSVSPNLPMRDDHLTLLEPDGTEIESKSMLDAIRSDPQLFPLDAVQPSRLDGPLWVDLFHSNSAEWMHREQLFERHPIYGPENILVCFRHQSRIAIIRWTDNRLLWAWGQGELDGPHDAQVLADGHILLFDNGLARGWSRALEIDPVGGEIVWEYRAAPPETFYTASKGSAQRLSNGNTLLAESDRGRAIEVDPSGEIVWEYICPHRLGDGAERAAIGRMVWLAEARVEPLLAAERRAAAGR